MGRIFKILSILLVLRTCNSTPFHLKYCKTDSECNDERFYCYEQRECVECTNCSAYNRQVSPTTRCAKTKDECGHCTSGTEAEHNFDGTFTCHPSTPSIINTDFNQNQKPTSNEGNKHLGLIIPAAILVPFFILCVIAYCCFKQKLLDIYKRFLTNQNLSCPQDQEPVTISLNNNPPPPPYSEKSPTAPPEEDPLIQRRRILEDDNQRANPFANPHYIRGGTYSDNPPLNIVDTEIPPSISEDIVDDENTQPSGWAPSPTGPTSPSTLTSDQPISFSNILSTVQHQPPDQPQSPNHHHQHFSQSTTATGTVPPPSIVITITNNNLNNQQVIN